MEVPDHSSKPEIIASPADQFDKIAFLYDELMEGVPYEYWLRYTEQILAKYGYAPKTVLDLCCGTGSMSRLLAEEGYRVCGVDISSGMIEIAKQRTEDAGLDIDFYVQDVARLRLSRKFDLAVSLFDSLNYILESASIQQVFYRVFEHLNPGGMFIFDMNTELALAIGLFNQDNLGSRRAVVHYDWRSSYDKKSGICRVHMDFVRKKNGRQEKVEVIHYQRAYDQMEIVRMLMTAGFQVHAVYDAYTLTEADLQSDRVFYVCRK